MVTISFESTRDEARGLDFLLGRFNFHTRRDGTTFVSESALIAMAREGLPFKVEGSATYEEIISALRNTSTPQVQRRTTRARRSKPANAKRSA